MNDAKLEKLKKLLEVASEDVATPADLIKLTEALVLVITKEREKLLATIENQKGEVSEALTDAVAHTDRRIASLEAILDRLDRAGKDAESRASTRLASEVKRLERKIPSRTDLSGLEREIKAIQEALVTVPTEITANPEAVRDALELLQPGDKLIIDAIEGLSEELDELRKRPTGDVVGGPRVLRYLSDVNVEGITNGQVIAWNSTTNRFEPASPGGGGGGAVDSVNGETGVVVLTTDDISDAAQTNKWATAGEKTKLGHMSVTQAVDLDAIETASHAAVTVTDSAEINFTLTGQDLTANIIAGSIDESKLDASTNASLDLADSAVQPAGIANFETTTQLNTRDTNNRDRANHTGTQLAATVSDFAATVRATVLTGLSLASATAISATDTVLVALGSLQKQITDLTTTVAAKVASVTAGTNVTVTGTATAPVVNVPTMTATVGGAVPTPPNNTTTFLRGDGTFAAPPGGGSGISEELAIAYSVAL